MQVKIFLMMLMALVMSAYRAFLGPPALASIVLIRGINGFVKIMKPIVFQARRGRVLGIFTVVPGILLIIPTFALNQVLRRLHQARHSITTAKGHAVSRITLRIVAIIPAMQKAILFWLKARADLIRLAFGTQHLFLDTGQLQLRR